MVEGALAGARVARRRIDMRAQHGEHPRVGALDVCPFVPVSGVTMDDCVALANEFGRRAADELGVPVFLYGYAARADHRRTLQQIRAGEYEALAERLAKPEWKPDYGPAAFVPEWGATCAGARDFLIAYNVNVLGTKEQAHRIALDVREAGRGPGQPGKLKAVRAIGWWVEEYGLAQVSINLEDYKTTPPHVAFEACVEAAKGLGLAVAGSELVGLIPLQALLLAADHYIAREGLFILDERQKIRLAVERLGLSSVSPFVPAKRIIEHMVPKDDDEPLASMSVRAFVEELGARSPAPGGGSASALVAAMGAALGAMVGWMTYGKRKFEDKDAAMRRLIPPLDEAMKALLPLVDKDTRAFDAYLAAVGMPKDSDAEQQGAPRRDAGGPQGRGRGAARGDAHRRPLLGRDGRDGARGQPRLALRPGGRRQGARGRHLGRLAQRRHQPAGDRGRGLPPRDRRGGRAARGARRGDARPGAHDARRADRLSRCSPRGRGSGRTRSRQRSARAGWARCTGRATRASAASSR